ncbi:UDP-glucose dehydrogenase family protein [Antarcticirhabdus aurantiaca]|uniref:UDP-glucose/GDP-mannose dehydrogenase family protein n=1 Tax=Antarcticirhabdus aurantiaca TaxID=2606717 RepID=A0ACD4NJS6_9HYPH|nr:UDP-glucose/GDP-mannose dehydrogenase family protein [Antarcticirhabdus aurantiaca]WAJ27050.1 UDP-glucose/GDP-mannose dehydrogenase family protein [Jeongeuplla avenae]
MRVTIFGTGYVGLVHAAVLAETGNEVVCVDTNEHKINRLTNGDIPIYEPGLQPLVQAHSLSRKLIFTTDAAYGVEHAELIFIAVGTPSGEDGSADLSHVMAVGRSIATHMTSDKIVVVKSTVPVGTCDGVYATMREILVQRGLDELDVHMASNPEFLKEGSAILDSMKPDRIIIGTDNREAENKLRELYAPFNRNHEKIITMDMRSSELTKYAANCLLATKITFMNEVAGIADRLGADIESVRRGIGSDPRIGYHFIYAGMGYGGSCFPKDIRALIHTSIEHSYHAGILEAVESRNSAQKRVLFEKIKKHFGDRLHGRIFAVWGLAFKPNTDDMREAPASEIMTMLWQAGAKIQAFDPVAMPECKRLHAEHLASRDLLLSDSKEDALDGSDALIICTEWKAFLSPDFDLIKGTLKEKIIFDGRNIYDPVVVKRYGIEYVGIGRRSA